MLICAKNDSPTIYCRVDNIREYLQQRILSGIDDVDRIQMLMLSVIIDSSSNARGVKPITAISPTPFQRLYNSR